MVPAVLVFKTLNSVICKDRVMIYVIWMDLMLRVVTLLMLFMVASTTGRLCNNLRILGLHILDLYLV